MTKSILLIFFFSFSQAFSSTTTAAPKTKIDTSSVIKVQIEEHIFYPGNNSDTIDLLIDCGGREISAFDLVIAYDQTLFDIVSIIPGRLIDSCDWEFFNTHEVTLTEGEQQNALRAWQITGLAELIADSTKPRCYSFDKTISLARLIVTRGELTNSPDTAIPIQFYWRKCADNTISDKSGNQLMLSKSVFLSNGEELKRSLANSINYTGAFPRCIKEDSPNRPLRIVNFFNGAVIIKNEIPKNKKESTEN